MHTTRNIGVNQIYGAYDFAVGNSRGGDHVRCFVVLISVGIVLGVVPITSLCTSVLLRVMLLTTGACFQSTSTDQTESLNLTKLIERVILLLEIRARAITHVVCMLSFQLSLLHLLDYFYILETGRA